MNKADGTLTSPNFGVNDLGNFQYYDINLNCTWIIDADQEYHINLEIDYFQVNNHNHKIDIHLHNFSNKVHHSSLIMGVVTISQSMMDQILSHHKYQNCFKVSILTKKVIQVQDLICWFNL